MCLENVYGRAFSICITIICISFTMRTKTKVGKIQYICEIQFMFQILINKKAERKIKTVERCVTLIATSFITGTKTWKKIHTCCLVYISKNIILSSVETYILKSLVSLFISALRYSKGILHKLLLYFTCISKRLREGIS